MGLDTYVHRLIMPSEELKNKVLSQEEIREKYPRASLIQFDEIAEPPDFPMEYLFKANFEFISFEKLFEKYSTPERPLNWNDGWVCGGGGTRPFGKKSKTYPECNWYYSFYIPGDTDTGHFKDEISLPGGDKYVGGCLYSETHPCFMHDNDELGYMRKGANGAFYDDMCDKSKKKSNWVFSKKVLDEYAKKYYDTHGDEYYGNARAYFRNAIQKPFGDGVGKLVWFWY